MSDRLSSLNMNEKKKVGIYIHVPFCLSKCHYCDFCSISRADDEIKEKYTQRLCDEIREFAEKICALEDVPVADTVYFGGGTPTLLLPSQIDRLLNAVSSSFGIAEKAEITAEMNPKTVDREYLRNIRLSGINRLSIGMQSVHDGELKALGRIHSFNDFKAAFDDARSSGFDNISVDLMYGIPDQTKESFADSVKSLISFDPEHISSYCLTIEDGTNFGRRRNSLALPDEDAVSEMYRNMSQLLNAAGYKKYEISNFSKVGRESRHNLKYWEYENYFGFGVAAHSFYNQIRFAHSRDIDAYIEGKSIIIETEKIEKNGAMDEFVMLGMRLEKGIDTSRFEKKFGASFFERFPNIYKYVPEYIAIDNSCCRFTESGMFVSNFILSDVLNFEP